MQSRPRYDAFYQEIEMTAAFENIIVTGKSGAGKQPRIDVLTRKFDLEQLSTGNIFRTYLDHFDALDFTGDLGTLFAATTNAFIPDEKIRQAIGLHDDANTADILLGLKAKYFINRGLFVPDYITNALFEAAFKNIGYRGAVLDGYPRTIEQARFLWKLVTAQHVRIDAIVLVENDDETILRRTTGRRICKTCGEVYHLDYRPPPENGQCENGSTDCEIIQRSDDTPGSLQARLNEFHAKTEPAIDYLAGLGIPFYTVPGNLPNYSPEAVEASVMAAMFPQPS